MEIQNWFKNKDYNTGVSLYKNSKVAKRRIVKVLEKGKSNKNLSLLISELRQLKNKPAANKNFQKPKTVVFKNEQEIGQKESELNQLKESSAAGYFKKIKYAELPTELKIRFRKLKDIFYDMIDLKVLLNEVEDSNEDEALSLILKIDKLDTQRSLIWKELDHWQLYKTKLPTDTDEDFTTLSDLEKDKKIRNFKSSISKKTKRIEKWNIEIESLKGNDKVKKLQQINRTKKMIHQHEINIREIQNLLCQKN